MSEGRLKTSVRAVYEGQTQRARLFRYALIVFDAATILYFIVSSALPYTSVQFYINAALGVLILMDFLARLWIARDRRQALLRIYTLADIIVLASLFLAPLLTEDVAFLRVLRGLRLLHAYHLLADLRRDLALFRRYEESVVAGVNLLVFLFVTTSLAFALFFESHAGIAAYVDALYFTVASLTTTGYGDITLPTTGGKLFSVAVMVIGVALFINFARALFQPTKARYECPECGLNRHDADAVHCKHCGGPVRIPTPGFTD